MIIEIDLIQNFLLALTVVCFTIGIALLIRASVKKAPTPPEQKEDDDKIRGYNKILTNAHKHAGSLLQEATIEAGKIISGSKQTNEQIKEQLDKVLQSIAAEEIHALKIATDTYETDYQKQLQTIQEQMHQQTQESIQNTKKNYEEKLDKFTGELLKSGLSTQEIVDKKTTELISVVEKEIAEYKQTQLEKIDEEVKKLLEKVYRDVLRISIPENVHQDLIIKSLEEAKKDGMFKL